MTSGDAGAALVADLRAHSLAGFAREAARLRLVWSITRHVHAQESWRLGDASRGDALGCGRITEHDLDVLAAHEVAAATGLSTYRAEQDVVVARTLCTRLTATLDALEAGRIDVGRARTLAEETSDLTDRLAREVEIVVLDGLPAPVLDGTGTVGPWDGPDPRRFTTLVRRAVAEVRTDVDEQVRREVRDHTGITAWVHPENPALATLTVTGPTEQVLTLHATLDARSRALGADERAGRTLGMVQVDLLHDAVCGETGPRSRAGSWAQVRRELGVVLHADTLLDDGPARGAAGQVRGTSLPLPVSAGAARVLADQAARRGATTCVLLTDDTGHVLRLVRVGATPLKGWTRTALTAAARHAIGKSPAPRHRTGTYAPTVGIADLVRARDPVCTFPGCAVPAARCDLDHTVPHPRGPTSVQNLSPRSRRCHRFKTAALWHCRTLTTSSGTVVAHEWTSPLGTRQVVEVPVMPGRTTGDR